MVQASKWSWVSVVDMVSDVFLYYPLNFLNCIRIKDTTSCSQNIIC